MCVSLMVLGGWGQSLAVSPSNGELGATLDLDYEWESDQIIGDDQVVQQANGIFSFYPSPAEEVLFLSVSEYVPSLEFAIYDMAARQVFTATIKFITVEVPIRIPVWEFSPGSYIARIMYNGETYAFPFLKR